MALGLEALAALKQQRLWLAGRLQVDRAAGAAPGLGPALTADDAGAKVLVRESHAATAGAAGTAGHFARLLGLLAFLHHQRQRRREPYPRGLHMQPPRALAL